jgi:hypothetical protein
MYFTYSPTVKSRLGENGRENPRISDLDISKPQSQSFDSKMFGQGTLVTMMQYPAHGVDAAI